jgi:hypothetical protein
MNNNRLTTAYPDKYQNGTSAPYEASVALKIPSFWVHEVVLQSSTDQAGNIRSVASKTNGLLPETSRADLSR